VSRFRVTSFLPCTRASGVFCFDARHALGSTGQRDAISKGKETNVAGCSEPIFVLQQYVDAFNKGM
jgi:hypothetical protein